MFIITLTYKTNLEEVDKYLKEHIDYLHKYTDRGEFIISGRKVPRSGGIILANIDTRDNLERIIAEDPFCINEVADFDIIEFVPSIISKELEHLRKE